MTRELNFEETDLYKEIAASFRPENIRAKQGMIPMFSDGKLPGDTVQSLSNDFDTNNPYGKENY